MAVSAYKGGKLKKRALLGTSLAVDSTRQHERYDYKSLYNKASGFKNDPEEFKRKMLTSGRGLRNINEAKRLGGQTGEAQAGLAGAQGDQSALRRDLTGLTSTGEYLGTVVDEAVGAHKKKKKESWISKAGKKVINPGWHAKTLQNTVNKYSGTDAVFKAAGVTKYTDLMGKKTNLAFIGGDMLKGLMAGDGPDKKRKAIQKGELADPNTQAAADAHWNSMSKEDRSSYNKKYRPESGAHKRKDPKKVKRQKAYLEYINQQQQGKRGALKTAGSQIEQRQAQIADLQKQREAQLNPLRKRAALYGGFF